MTVVLLGFAIGTMTSFLQTILVSPWFSLVNSVTPWLVPAFVLGIRSRRFGWRAAAGAAVTLCELLGYMVTAWARGYSSGLAITLFWSICAAVGGPIFGLAGHLRHYGVGPRRELGIAILAGAFIAEGIVTYAIRLHELTSAVLFVLLGAVLVPAFERCGRAVLNTARWLLLVLPAGIVGDLLLGLVYNQTL